MDLESRSISLIQSQDDEGTIQKIKCLLCLPLEHHHRATGNYAQKYPAIIFTNLRFSFERRPTCVIALIHVLLYTTPILSLRACGRRSCVNSIKHIIATRGPTACHRSELISGRAMGVRRNIRRRHFRPPDRVLPRSHVRFPRPWKP